VNTAKRVTRVNHVNIDHNNILSNFHTICGLPSQYLHVHLILFISSKGYRHSEIGGQKTKGGLNRNGVL